MVSVINTGTFTRAHAHTHSIFCTYPPVATSTYTDIPPATPPPTILSPSMAAMPSANPKFLRLQGCNELMTQALTKAWDTYLISEKTTPSGCTFCFFVPTLPLSLPHFLSPPPSLLPSFPPSLPGIESISRASRGSEKRGILRSSINRKKDMDILRHTTIEGIVRVSLHTHLTLYHDVYLTLFQHVYLTPLPLIS